MNEAESDRMSLDEFVDALLEEYDLERSEEAQEAGRMVANLQD